MSFLNYSKGINPYPINLSYDTSIRVGEKVLQWCNYNHAPKKMKLTNTGKTVMISGKWYQERPYIKNGPLTDSYVFSQIHFHWGATDFDGSEHRVQGKKLPMEMHIVHFNTKYETLEEAKGKIDGLAVTVYFLQVDDKPNYSLNPIVAPLGEVNKVFKSIHIEPFPLTNLNFKLFETGYFLYCGSVGREDNPHLILWLVYPEALTISHAQIARFRELESSTGDLMRSNVHDLQNVINPEGVFFVDRILSDGRKRESSLLCLPSLRGHSVDFALAAVKEQKNEAEQNFFKVNVEMGSVPAKASNVDTNKTDYPGKGSLSVSNPVSQQTDQAVSYGDQVLCVKEFSKPNETEMMNQALESVDSNGRRRESSFLCFPSLRDNSTDFTFAPVKEQMNEAEKNFIKVNVEMRSVTPPASNVDQNTQELPHIPNTESQKTDQAEVFSDQIPLTKDFSKYHQIETSNKSSEKFIKEPNYNDSWPFKERGLTSFVPATPNFQTQGYASNILSKPFAAKPVTSCTYSSVSLADAKGSTTARFSSEYRELYEKEKAPSRDEFRTCSDESEMSIGEARGSTTARIRHTAQRKIISQPKDSTVKYTQRGRMDQSRLGQSDISLRESRGSTVKRIDSASNNKTEPISLSPSQAKRAPDHRSDSSLKGARGSTIKRVL